MSCVQYIPMNMKFFSIFSLQWLLVVCILLSFSATDTTARIIPRLRPFRRLSSTSVTEDFQEFYFNQTLDHFTFSPRSESIFTQKVVINSKYWGGAKVNAPIFAYFGAELPLDQQIGTGGFIKDIASQFKALLIYLEHRYYGTSMPFGSPEESLKNASTMSYFNSAQALADYAEILLSIKKRYNAEDCPVIVFGGSYGGMLASWFRLKYPHIALGALASSAPIMYFDDITPTNAYYAIVSKNFREASETCYQTIRDSWSEIDKIGSKPNGLSMLSNKFKTCSPLNSTNELKEYLKSIYAASVQYDGPPNYPLKKVCGSIDGQPHGTDILSKIFAAVFTQTEINHPNTSCYVNSPQTAEEKGWSWQTCTEIIVPMSGTDNNTMFQPEPYNLSNIVQECKKNFSIAPQPHWVTTYYGGHDVKLILRRFGSNIIFSNGLRDPYSAGGILENISDTIVALPTKEGVHCSDLSSADQTTDPAWLVKQRKAEVEIIKRWIAKYQADLKELKH